MGFGFGFYGFWFCIFWMSWVVMGCDGLEGIAYWSWRPRYEQHDDMNFTLQTYSTDSVGHPYNFYPRVGRIAVVGLYVTREYVMRKL
jgi:hypothetical protein